MFDVKTAVKIALLENTGLADVAIKSVVDAVVGMTTTAPDDEKRIIVADVNLQFIVDAAMTYATDDDLDSDDILGLVDRLDDLQKRLSPVGEPCCWIIERVGHPVSMTHYQTVADSQRSLGAIVTPHVSRLA